MLQYPVGFVDGRLAVLRRRTGTVLGRLPMLRSSSRVPIDGLSSSYCTMNLTTGSGCRRMYRSGSQMALRALNAFVDASAGRWRWWPPMKLESMVALTSEGARARGRQTLQLSDQLLTMDLHRACTDHLRGWCLLPGDRVPILSRALEGLKLHLPHRFYAGCR